MSASLEVNLCRDNGVSFTTRVSMERQSAQNTCEKSQRGVGSHTTQVDTHAVQYNSHHECLPGPNSLGSKKIQVSKTDR